MPQIQKHHQPDSWKPLSFSHRSENGRESFYADGECIFQIDLAECCIRYGRLQPGGEPLIGGHGRSEGWRLWWGRSNDYKPVEIETFEFDVADSNHVCITIIAVDEDGMRTNTVLKVGYSSTLESYVYDFEQSLAVTKDKPWFGTATGLYQGIEYCNFWPSGAFNHTSCGPVEQPDAEPHLQGYYGRELWQWMVYEESEGNYCKVPFNRLTRTTSENMRPCDDGIFILATEDFGNPTLQFMGDTGRRTFLHLCHAIYDVHVNLSEIGRIAPGRELNAHYRLFDTPTADAEALVTDAEIAREPVPWIERRCVLPRATIPGINRFDVAMDPSEPCDDYFWRPVHTGYRCQIDEYIKGAAMYHYNAGWDRENHQLVLDSPFTTFIGWGLYGANFVAVKPGHRYRFSANVDLTNVEGEGVCLAWTFFSDRVGADGKAGLPVLPTESESVNGTGRFELTGESSEAIDCVIDHTDMPFHYNFLEFWIVLKGKGRAVVSDVEILEV